MAKTDESVTEKLARAKKAGAELTGSTERLNNSISRVESALRALNLGVAASTSLQSHDLSLLLGHPLPSPREVEFTKHQGTWKLMYVTGGAPSVPTILLGTVDTTGPYSPEVRVPVLEASRAVRFEIARALPALIDRILSTVLEQAKEADGLARSVESLAEDLEK